MSTEPSVNILGHTDIPKRPMMWVPSGKLNEILESLVPGQATVIETQSHKHARYLVAMLHTMQQLRTGERRTISTRTIEQFVYVWPVVENEQPEDDGNPEK